MIDLSPLVQGLAGLACAAVTAAVPVLVPALLKRWKLDLTQAQSDTIVGACDRAADLAYKFLVDNKAAYDNVEIRNVAMAKAVAYVAAHVPDAMKALGVTPEHVHDIVEAHLGARYVADQNISIAPVPVASATPAAPATT